MNLRDLEYLVALAEHRHFGRAAAACYVSQPTLSTQVRKLENQLGVDLIERNPRSVLLTAAGEQVVARAKVILDQVRDIRGIARQAQDPRAGTLRLGAFPTIAPYLLPHIVPVLRDQLPDLELQLVEEKTGELVERLHSGLIDAAILALPVPTPNADGLNIEPLFREDFLLAVPEDHPLAVRAAREGSLGIDALHDTELLLLAEGHCLREQALEVCHVTGSHEREGFRASSLETLRHMVASGAGATLIPRLAVSPPVPTYDGIRIIPFTPPAPHRDVALVSRRSSVFRELLPEIAQVARTLPDGLVTPLAPVQAEAS